MGLYPFLTPELILIYQHVMVPTLLSDYISGKYVVEMNKAVRAVSGESCQIVGLYMKERQSRNPVKRLMLKTKEYLELMLWHQTVALLALVVATLGLLLMH